MNHRQQLMSASTRIAFAAAADYDPAALLAKPLDEVKAPVPMPLGSYVGTFVKYEFTKAKTEKQQTVCAFQVRLDEPLPDVDEEAWKLATDPAQGGKLPADNPQKYEFWITPDALYRLKECGEEHCKVDADSVANTAELIEAMIGRQCIFVMSSAPNKKDPNKPYHNLSATAALPE